MSANEYSKVKCFQIIGDVEAWSQKCQKFSNYKSLSPYAQKSFGGITSFFAEMMYTYHYQSPEQWTSTALHNVLTEIYPKQLVIQPTYAKAIESVLDLFIKYLQTRGIIKSEDAQKLCSQLKIAASAMYGNYKQPDELPQTDDVGITDEFELPPDFTALNEPETSDSKKPKRSEPCHCGSGKKYKKCCASNDANAELLSKLIYPKGQPEPTLEQWQKLYEVANNIKKLQPWKFLKPLHFITMRFPTYDQLIGCTTFGSDDKFSGVVIYPGTESIGRICQLLEAPDAFTSLLARMEQDQLLCGFGSRDEMSPDDRRIQKKLGLHFRGQTDWIFFRAATPGYLPNNITAKHADFLLAVLQNFVIACTYIKDNVVQVNFEANEMFLRFYSPKKKLWINQVVPLNLTGTLPSTSFDDEKLCAYLRKKQYNGAHLEFDAPRLPMLVKNESVTYCAHLTILIDKKDNQILNIDRIDANESVGDFIVGLFIDYIDRCGRPLSISVRNYFVGSYLEDFCQKVGIELIFGKSMPLCNSIAFQALKLTNYGLLQSFLPELLLTEQEQKQENNQQQP